MAKSTLALRTLKARPRAKTTAGSIEDIDGQHLIEHLSAYIESIRADGLKDETKGRYLRIKEVVARGRTVTIISESGYFGEPGVAYDVTTGKVTHKKGEDEAFTLETRTTIYAPPGSPVFIAALEYKSGALHGGILLDDFKKTMLDRYPDYFFPTETVQEKDAWAASGQLKEVSVVVHKRPLSLSDGLDPDRDRNEVVLGSVVHSALPPRGASWPTKVWDALRNNQLDAASFVGIRAANDSASPDESVYVTVERDGQQKRFELGTDGKPSIREILTEDGVPSLDLDSFHRAVDPIVKKFYADLSLAWVPKWLTGDAATNWLKHRWPSS